LGEDTSKDLAQKRGFPGGHGGEKGDTSGRKELVLRDLSRTPKGEAMAYPRGVRKEVEEKDEKKKFCISDGYVRGERRQRGK